MVLLNPGLLHRVGPNRTYVKLARALAAEGYTVVRFDFSGHGDSRPRADHLPYVQSAPAEAREAMDWLARHRDAQHFVLIGHCAGAGIGLLAARDDRRVAGAVLINMEGGDAQWTEFDRKKKVSQQYARDYGQRALVSRERWARLLTGRADYRNIARIVLKDILWYRVTNLGFRAGQLLHARQSSVRAEQAVVAQTYLDPIIERGAGLLLLHSEGSTGLEQIRANSRRRARAPSGGRLDPAHDYSGIGPHVYAGFEAAPAVRRALAVAAIARRRALRASANADDAEHRATRVVGAKRQSGWTLKS